jgi:L-2-hydroxyglutarate oxidase LhgO
MKNNYDFLIVGGGILGLSMARSLLSRYPDAKIGILEKEDRLGVHTSGRNSGVLHQGIYYPSNSLKARFCVNGAKLLAEFCDEHKLNIDRCGKVILPLRPEQDSQLDLLKKRSLENGAVVEMIDAVALKELEPAAKSISGRALFSPRTSVVNPVQILLKLHQMLADAGVQFHFSTKLVDIHLSQKRVVTNSDSFYFGTLVNCAGLYADCVAHAFGLSKQFTLMPFKGVYKKLVPDLPFSINRLIYPVPDLRVPFLGVHFTKSIAGDIYLGPTAMLALGRENYSGLNGVNFGESLRFLTLTGLQYLENKQNFRNFAHQEIRHLLRSELAAEAQQLVPQLNANHIIKSTKVGIRAQLFNLKTRQLEMDFLVKEGPSSVHILNAVSPGFTSAFSFADFVVEEYLSSGSFDRKSTKLEAWT